MFDDNIIEIYKLHKILNPASTAEVHLSYSGTELGNVFPWLVKIGNYEFKASNKESAAKEVLLKLRTDLNSKISHLKRQTSELEQASHALRN